MDNLSCPSECVEELQEAADPSFALEQRHAIEMVSVSGFLRKIPHDKPWQLQSVMRFGNMVIQLAKGLGIEYRTTFDPYLGPVQIFPETLVLKVYRHLAPTLGWPRLIEVEGTMLPNSSEPLDPQEETRIASGVANYLRVIVARSPSDKSKRTAKVMLRAVERSCERLKAAQQTPEVPRVAA